jgi:hypothetical protein
VGRKTVAVQRQSLAAQIHGTDAVSAPQMQFGEFGKLARPLPSTGRLCLKDTGSAHGEA